jgi:hypothetical protein
MVHSAALDDRAGRKAARQGHYKPLGEAREVTPLH